MMEPSKPLPSLASTKDKDNDLKFWNQAARRYSQFIDSGDIFRKHLLDPVILSWLKDANDKKILDAGCGQGYLANATNDLGAEVIGIDGSDQMIKIAKERYRRSSLNFLQADLRDQMPFRDAEFDGVVANLVLMDFDPIDGTLKEFYRILKPNGVFIFSILHPAFASGELGKTFTEFLFHKPPHYRIFHYISPFKKIRNLGNLGIYTHYYHRPLEYYFKVLKESSFVVTDLCEPVFDKDFIRNKNNFLKLCAEVPIFLILKGQKSAGAIN